MHVPLQISFDGVPESDAVLQDILACAEDLERFHEDITACHVVVASPHHHGRQGRLYSVRIHVTIPGREIAVGREHHDEQAHTDVHVAIRDAFQAARRQIQDAIRLHRHLVKAHATPPHGRVLKLFPDAGYGFIETPDGRELYFHRHAVLGGGFDSLRVGSEVRFHESSGVEGPSASSVRPVGQHHHLV